MTDQKRSELFSNEEVQEQRDRWLAIGLATGPTDWDKAERGISLAYEAAGLTAPKRIIKLQSPLAGLIAASQILNRNQVRNQVRSQVGDQVGDQVWNQVWNQVCGQVRSQVRSQVGYQVRNQVWDHVCYGAHDAHWLAQYSIFKELTGVRRLEGLILLAESTGWFWPYENLVIMTERPSKILFQKTDVVWIEYPDGWFVYPPHLNEMEVLAVASL